MKTSPDKPKSEPTVPDTMVVRTIDRPDTNQIVDVRFMITALWRGRWIILLLTFVGLGLGYLDLRGFSPTYTAEMIVEEIDQGGDGGGSQRISGLASSLGLAAPVGDRATSLDRLQIIFSTTKFAALIDQKHGLLRKVYGSWDSETQQWNRPTGRRFEIDQRIRRALSFNTWQEPNLEGLARYLSSNIVIKPLKKGGAKYKRITFQYSQPEFAAYLLELVFQEGENYIRVNDKAEGLERRQYLLRQLQRNTFVDLRTVLMEMLSREEQSAMLLEGDLPYLARVIQPVRVASSPSEPNLGAIVGGRVLGMIALAMLIVVIITVFRRESSIE